MSGVRASPFAEVIWSKSASTVRWSASNSFVGSIDSSSCVGWTAVTRPARQLFADPHPLRRRAGRAVGRPWDLEFADDQLCVADVDGFIAVVPHLESKTGGAVGPEETVSSQQLAPLTGASEHGGVDRFG